MSLLDSPLSSRPVAARQLCLAPFKRFSLKALFVTITLCAMGLALARAIDDNQDSWDRFRCALRNPQAFQQRPPCVVEWDEFGVVRYRPVTDDAMLSYLRHHNQRTFLGRQFKTPDQITEREYRLMNYLPMYPDTK